jgi:hypothetical protein
VANLAERGGADQPITADGSSRTTRLSPPLAADLLDQKKLVPPRPPTGAIIWSESSPVNAPAPNLY